ncbi:MAG: hypothetical protein WC429_24270, partial [Verrucomicrobiia bacterium]
FLDPEHNHPRLANLSAILDFNMIEVRSQEPDHQVHHAKHRGARQPSLHRLHRHQGLDAGALAKIVR